MNLRQTFNFVEIYLSNLFCFKWYTFWYYLIKKTSSLLFLWEFKTVSTLYEELKYLTSVFSFVEDGINLSEFIATIMYREWQAMLMCVFFLLFFSSSICILTAVKHIHVLSLCTSSAFYRYYLFSVIYRYIFLSVS